MHIRNIYFDNSPGNYLDKAFVGGVLPPNAIIAKNITGIGATTTELNCKRNSIIVVDSRAIIDNKGAKYPNLLIVREGIKRKSIINYLTAVSHDRKIMITPESFFKLIDACEILKIDLYNDFFILLDECDKIIKGADFRKEFPIFMDTFFKFKNKSLVTATYIEPTDPRFDSFEVYNIIPKHHNPRNIELILTNNTIFAARTILRKNTKNKWLIFVNSNHIIKQIINYMDENNQYSVFCGADYIHSYRGYKLNHIGTEIDVDQFSNINFFTGRYFAGLDIDIEEDCNIMIISDPSVVKHSALDPLTDVVQILGRVRYQKTIQDIKVVCNENPDLDVFTESELKDMFVTCEEDYSEIAQKRDLAQNSNSKVAYSKLLMEMPYAKFLDANGNRSHFLLDCYTYFNKIKSYYISYKSIVNAFKDCKLYNSDLKYFEINMRNRIWEFPISSTMLKQSNKIKFKQKVLDIVAIIEALNNGEIEISVEELTKNLTLFGMIYQLYNEMGNIKLLYECTTESELKELYKKFSKNKNFLNKSFVEDLYKQVLPTIWYSSDELKDIYSTVMAKNGITDIKATPKVYEMHFNIKAYSKKIKGKTVRGYEILDYA